MTQVALVCQVNQVSRGREVSQVAMVFRDYQDKRAEKEIGALMDVQVYQGAPA